MAPQFTILNPCPKKWDQLEGEGRQRYCDACRKNVHSIGEYSADEWDKIWRESGGNACGLIASEPFAIPRSRRAILMGALLTAVSPLMAASGFLKQQMTVTVAGERQVEAAVALPVEVTMGVVVCVKKKRHWWLF